MRIQHNIMAMNSYRNYNNNVKQLSGNLEKLSSGYKINRAGDDAAGLAISEKMRAQITGLDAAQKNVKDGVSLVKTAEGAMQEIQDMLNRMSYLAVQSANGTYDNNVDRANLQKEVASLISEIDRIADSSNFNGIKLMDGTQTIMDSYTMVQASGTVAASIAIEVAESDREGNELVGEYLDGITVQIGGKSYSVKYSTASNAEAGLLNGVYTVTATSTALSTVLTSIAADVMDSEDVKVKNMSGDEVGVSVTFSDGMLIVKATNSDQIDFSTMPTVSVHKGLRLQIGDSANNYNQMRVNVGDMHANMLFGGNKIDISNQEDAAKAVNFIKYAINTVSATRGDLGAVQNRLEHTLNNLSVMEENIQDAESTIRDTDVADEMMSYTKNNILIQSAQAMLAQSNQVPQGVLQLLQ